MARTRRVWKDDAAKGCTSWMHMIRNGLQNRPKKELDALLSDEALGKVLFLVLGNKIDIPYAASEVELCYHLGLTNVTTGRGRGKLVESNVCPLEVFMCSIVRKTGYGDGFKWVG